MNNKLYSEEIAETLLLFSRYFDKLHIGRCCTLKIKRPPPQKPIEVFKQGRLVGYEMRENTKKGLPNFTLTFSIPGVQEYTYTTEPVLNEDSQLIYQIIPLEENECEQARIA